MKIKGKRILKNGALAGYVFYEKEKKWKWRIIKGPIKNKKGGFLNVPPNTNINTINTKKEEFVNHFLYHLNGIIKFMNNNDEDIFNKRIDINIKYDLIVKNIIEGFILIKTFCRIDLNCNVICLAIALLNYKISELTHVNETNCSIYQLIFLFVLPHFYKTNKSKKRLRVYESEKIAREKDLVRLEKESNQKESAITKLNSDLNDLSKLNKNKLNNKEINILKNRIKLTNDRLKKAKKSLKKIKSRIKSIKKMQNNNSFLNHLRTSKSCNNTNRYYNLKKKTLLNGNELDKLNNYLIDLMKGSVYLEYYTNSNNFNLLSPIPHQINLDINILDIVDNRNILLTFNNYSKYYSINVNHELEYVFLNEIKKKNIDDIIEENKKYLIGEIDKDYENDIINNIENCNNNNNNNNSINQNNNSSNYNNNSSNYNINFCKNLYLSFYLYDLEKDDDNIHENLNDDRLTTHWFIADKEFINSIDCF